MTTIPYDDTAQHPGPLAFQWTYSEAGGEPSYTASGTCPVCHCPMTRTFGYGQALLTKGGFRGRRTEAGAESYHTLCQCRTLHHGRPADERFGCGAMLVLAPPGPSTNGPTP
ncbi:hypothetical protein AB0958_02380 [Streptomyces sp. NPDC006655]|uniref:hypothetical protein n=1 Tax=Streptomyces sp. NPDC006655 TaxID=3156898 RepID=UPI003455284B